LPPGWPRRARGRRRGTGHSGRGARPRVRPVLSRRPGCRGRIGPRARDRAPHRPEPRRAGGARRGRRRGGPRRPRRPAVVLIPLQWARSSTDDSGRTMRTTGVLNALAAVVLLAAPIHAFAAVNYVQSPPLTKVVDAPVGAV